MGRVGDWQLEGHEENVGTIASERYARRCIGVRLPLRSSHLNVRRPLCTCARKLLKTLARPPGPGDALVPADAMQTQTPRSSAQHSQPASPRQVLAPRGERSLDESR